MPGQSNVLGKPLIQEIKREEKDEKISEPE